jgi:hypothetical protein
VRAWSPKSRRRLLQRAGETVWPQGRALVLTLTFATDPGAERAKRDLHAFRLGLRDQGHDAWVWKLEFQRRGVVHFHLLVWGPATDGPGLVVFRRWVWKRWERIRGERTQVDVQPARARDVPRYFVGYGAKGEKVKSHQHNVPSSWRHVGRWWGFSEALGRAPTRACPLDLGEFDQVRRLLRRLRATKGVRGARQHGPLQGVWVLCEDGERVFGQLLDVLAATGCTARDGPQPKAQRPAPGDTSEGGRR